MTLFSHLCLYCLTALLPVGHPWMPPPQSRTLAETIQPPQGFTRIPDKPGSFTAWLRSLPLRDTDTVYLYDGRIKPNQEAQYAVLAIDVGKQNLQQCADAVMRLRAEYLHTIDPDSISFNFTSGHAARWQQWRQGLRPIIRGNHVTWRPRAEADDSYRNFKKYLQTVFAYAGSASLERELTKVRDPQTIQPGDVFIQGGFPGHAVMVLDVVANQQGQRQFLLAQSYMPAQDMHVLKVPGSGSPWYPARATGVLHTPEWRFTYDQDLYRW